MKNTITLLLLICFTITYGQEHLKQSFKIPHQKKYSDHTLYLQKKESKKRNTLPNYDIVNGLKEKFLDSIRKIYPPGNTISYTSEEIINGQKVLITKDVIVDTVLLKKMENKYANDKISNTIKIDACDECYWRLLFWKIKTKKRKGYVLFENDTVFVNPYLRSDKQIDRGDVLFYKLKDRQSMRLGFDELTITALTIPIKYRFKGEGELNEEFSSSFNVNLFAGYSIGKQLFFHRKKVGNKTNIWKFTFGGFIGGNVIEMNSSNSKWEDTNRKINQGALSYGFGIAYSFNKVNLAAFVGWDKIVGENRDLWNYNDKAWLGLGIGYDLFKL